MNFCEALIDEALYAFLRRFDLISLLESHSFTCLLVIFKGTRCLGSVELVFEKRL